MLFFICISDEKIANFFYLFHDLIIWTQGMERQTGKLNTSLEHHPILQYDFCEHHNNEESGSLLNAEKPHSGDLVGMCT